MAEKNLFPTITGYEERTRIWEARKRRAERVRAPGSDAAILAGCLCPTLDNGHGLGYMGREGLYVMFGACPLHGDQKADTGAPCTESCSNSSEPST